MKPAASAMPRPCPALAQSVRLAAQVEPLRHGHGPQPDDSDIGAMVTQRPRRVTGLSGNN